MKLFARLLSHAFAIALVVLLAIGFIYRGELFPELELPGAVATQTPADVEVADPSQPGPLSGKGKVTRASPEKPATGKETFPMKEATPATATAPDRPMQVPATNAAGIRPGDGKDTAGVQQPAGTEQPQPLPGMTAGPTDGAALASPDSLPADESVALSRTLQGLAREAYWLRDIETAEHYYRRMISADPENPDGYGELANLYLGQGDRKAAATGYYEAGLRLVKRGLVAHATDLADVLRGLGDARADALERAIAAARAE